MRSLGARMAVLVPRLGASARELVERGAIGVAARIHAPGLDSPLELAVGHADRGRERRLGGDELFPIASQSKLLTAALTLLLADRGGIALDDPVSRYLADAPAVDPSATIAQLLNHTSGIGNFIHTLNAVPPELPHFSFADLAALARVQGPQSQPGARFDYNNTDVLVLARICEQVTGRSRGELLQDWICGPLAMSDTMIGFGDPDRRARFAKGYYVPSTEPGRAVDVTGARDLSIAGAAGDITASLSDLARLFEALRDPANPTGLCMGDLVQYVVDTGPDQRPVFSPRTYGCGVESWLWGGRRVWGHRGSFYGYHSGTFLEPVTGIVMTMFMSVLTDVGPQRFLDGQLEGCMRFMGEAMTMMADALEYPP